MGWTDISPTLNTEAGEMKVIEFDGLALIGGKDRVKKRLNMPAVICEGCGDDYIIMGHSYPFDIDGLRKLIPKHSISESEFKGLNHTLQAKHNLGDVFAPGMMVGKAEGKVWSKYDVCWSHWFMLVNNRARIIFEDMGIHCEPSRVVNMTDYSTMFEPFFPIKFKLIKDNGFSCGHGISGVRCICDLNVKSKFGRVYNNGSLFLLSDEMSDYIEKSKISGIAFKEMGYKFCS